MEKHEITKCLFFVLIRMPCSDDPLARLYGRNALEDTLELLWKKQGKPGKRRPRCGNRELDLYVFFESVRSFGGISKVHQNRLMQPIAELLRLSLTATSSGYSLRLIYLKWLKPYEKELEQAIDESYRKINIACESGRQWPECIWSKDARLPRKRSRWKQSGMRVCSEDVQQENLTEAEKAAVFSRLSVNEMEPEEQVEFASLLDLPDLFLDIRNHILRLWYRDVSHRTSCSDVLSTVPKRYHDLTKDIFIYLVRQGLINFGFLGKNQFPILSGEQMEKVPHVVIVGAGIAGLAAARLGGRIYTRMSLNNTPIELGAMLVTGVQQNPLNTLCRQLNLILEVVQEDCPLYDVNGCLVPKELDILAEDIFNDALEETSKMRNLYKNQRHVSLGSILKKLLEEKLMIFRQTLEANDCMKLTTLRRLVQWHIANLEYACAADLENVSLFDWDQDDPWALEGLARGFEKIGHDMDNRSRNPCIFLRHEVKSVSKKDSVIVKVQTPRASMKEVSCDCVLITVPLGVLKERSISFYPDLPIWKQEAIDSLGFGGLNKVCLVFEELFWKHSIFGALTDSSNQRGEFYIFWDMTKCSGQTPVLVTMICEPFVGRNEIADNHICVQRAMNILRRIFPNAPEPKESFVTRWSGDKYAGGAYSYIGVNSTSKTYDLMAENVGDVLYFAGEATNGRYPTTCAGAFFSGLREAGKIMKHLQLDILQLENTQKRRKVSIFGR
ncbi:Lysine-specific histone demethylase 1 homolog 1 [Galdieria sulphuraria]|nr:Lysine-specific histone demethylase 1 homolog 1 [Galdieria sulphuraria]